MTFNNKFNHNTVPVSVRFYKKDVTERRKSLSQRSIIHVLVSIKDVRVE